MSTATKSCVPLSPLSGSLNVFEAAAECGCAVNVCAWALLTSQ